MLKDEAIQAMKEGKRVTHRHFDEDEWMTMEGGFTIVFEDGVECTLKQFFATRTEAIGFADGYSLFVNPTTFECDMNYTDCNERGFCNEDC